MPRAKDPRITEAALDAALALLMEGGPGAVTMEEVAARAGVGRPALYRRFRDRAALVAAAVSQLLPAMTPAPPCGGDVRAALRDLLEQATPEDPDGYAALLGGLMAEHRRHPELLRAFREHVLLPRRAVVRAVVERGRREGVLASRLDPELAVDLLGGPFLARVHAGLPITAAWREELLARWWAMAAA